MTVDESIRDAILTSQNQEILTRLACENGMESLAADGKAKAAAHLTTLTEVRRVLYGC